MHQKASATAQTMTARYDNQVRGLANTEVYVETDTLLFLPLL